jgi:hypothetical protein
MADLTPTGITEIKATNSTLGRALQEIVDAVNNLGQQANAEPVGQTPAPSALTALNVIGGAGIVHATISDPNSGYRGKSYHIETIPDGGNWDTDAHPIHLGPARAYRGALGPGVYHFRACSGFGTSNPSPWIYKMNVSANGSTPPPFPKSTGSGTGGGGWGNVPYTGNVPPKRA